MTVRAARDVRAPRQVPLERNLPAKTLFPIIEAQAKAGVTAVPLMQQRLKAE